MALNKTSKKNQAKALIQQNKFTEAKKLLLKSCKRKGNDLDAWLLLAFVNRRLAMLNEAAACCQHVLNRNPGHAHAWHLLGSCHHLSGDLTTAITSYKKAVSYDSALAESYLFMGDAFRENADLPSAIESYTKATQINKSYLEALTNLGATLIETGDLNKAWGVLSKANTIYPNTPLILCNMALVKVDIGMPNEALPIAEKAISIDPSFVDPLRILGTIYTQKRDLEMAIESYQKILNLYPDDIGSISALASIYEKRKDFDKSLKLILPLIESKTYNLETLITYSRLAENIDVPHDTVKLLLENIESKSVSNKQKIDPHYELGRYFDKENKFDEAFFHYQKANSLTREAYSNLVTEKSKIDPDEPIPKWTTELNYQDWKKLPVSSSLSTRPIFIIGMHRSGTSLTEQILSSHSAIHGAGEIEKIPQIVRKQGIHPWDNESDFIDKHRQLTSTELDTLADEYLNSKELISSDKIKVIDKQNNNYANISLIRRMFPEAAIIHISRAPIDNCLSVYFQKFGTTLPYTTDLLETAAVYKRYEALAKYWNEQLKIKILHIHYEDLVNNLEETTKKMIEYCGLKWEENCLNFHNTKRDVNTPSYHQVRSPIYTKSVDRWKNYEKHIQPLTELFEK